MTLKNSTNKRKKIAALVLAAALAARAAHAADIPDRKAAPVYAPPPQAFSWTGFYAGLNAGGGFAAANGFNSYLGTNGGRASGAIGGAQAGYNYQLSPLSLRIEKRPRRAARNSRGNRTSPGRAPSLEELDVSLEVNHRSAPNGLCGAWRFGAMSWRMRFVVPRTLQLHKGPAK